MEVVASNETVRLVRSRGGRLYVWPRKARCCGGAITLECSTEPPQSAEFRQALTGEIELYLPAGMPNPSSLHVEVARRGRLRAFWNGLAWVS